MEINPKISPETPKLQIYPTQNTGVSPFWKDKYEREAKKNWDVFYKRHQDRFFKDRHYLDKEWGAYFEGAGLKIVLEVGCGAGNTIYPLVATYPDIFVHACDFSPRAVDLVKSHKEFKEDRVNAFVCDLTVDELCKEVLPSSVDIVTMIFVLSAVSPEKMSLVLQNIKKVLKPNGFVLVRDYAIGDLAQERFTCKDQKISENFYVRGDGTGFEAEEIGVCCKQVENRSRELVMNRRWIQAVFRHSDGNTCSLSERGQRPDPAQEVSRPSLENGNNLTEVKGGFDLDISEGIAVEMFGISPAIDEVKKPKLPALILNPYVGEAISPLFATASELIPREDVNVDSRPALILCHVLRRVDEPSILSAASQFGFRLVDR